MPLPLPAPAVRGGPGFRLLPTPIQSIVYTKSMLYAMKSISRPRSAGHRARPRRAVFVPGQRGFCGVASFCRIRPKGPPSASFLGIFDLFITLCIFALCFYGVNPTCRDVPHRHALAKSRGSFCENAQKINGQAAFALRACPFALFFRLFSAVHPTQAGTACSGASGSRAVFAQ